MVYISNSYLYNTGSRFSVLTILISPGIIVLFAVLLVIAVGLSAHSYWHRLGHDRSDRATRKREGISENETTKARTKVEKQRARKLFFRNLLLSVSVAVGLTLIVALAATVLLHLTWV